MENQFLASGTCGAQGGNLIWTLTTDGVLTISGKGDIKGKLEDIPWLDYREAIKSVVLQNGVTGIGNYAFVHCRSMESIAIPMSVTSIEDWTFDICPGLISIEVAADNPCFSSQDGVLFNKDRTELLRYPMNKPDVAYNIPDGVKHIGKTAFQRSHGLVSITISKDVKDMAVDLFNGCRGLASIEVAADNPWYSSQDGVLFSKDKTKLLRYPKNKPGDAYIIPDEVKHIGAYAFYRCSGLTSIVIPEGVTGIGNDAFWGCSNLPSLVIPEGVTSIGDSVFYECFSLTTITIPSSVKSIAERTFKNSCLTELIVRAVVPPVVKTVFWSSRKDDMDKSIPVYVPAESIEAYRTAKGWKEFTNYLPMEERREK